MSKKVKHIEKPLATKSAKEKTETKASVGQSKPAQSGVMKVNFVKNLLLFTVCLAITTVLFKENKGYNWVWNDLIHENLNFIKSSSKLNKEQKYQAKFGLDAAVIEYIKQNTPDTAIIQMPPSQVLMSDSANKFLTGLGGIKSKIWTMYFLYPRKLIYESDKDGFKPNYVFCFNQWGYELLNYAVTNRKEYEVLPIQP